MKLKTGYAFNCGDLFMKFDSKKIKTKGAILKEHYKTREKPEIAVRVFLYCMYLILLDIIENNVTFVLPTPQRSQIQMGAIEGEDFKQARRNGKFEDVDFVAANFMGYQLEFRYWTKTKEKFKRIYVNNSLKDKITEYTNKGKRYF